MFSNGSIIKREGSTFKAWEYRLCSKEHFQTKGVKSDKRELTIYCKLSS